MKSKIWAACLALLCAFDAQAALTVVADYPLATDLEDASGNYDDIILSAKAGFPEPDEPAPGLPLCQNGINIIDDFGQMISTPALPTLDLTDFQIEIEFKMNAIETDQWTIFSTELDGWFGLQVYPFEGQLSAHAKTEDGYHLVRSDFVIETQRWYAAQLRYENNQLQIFLDGKMVHHAVVGELDPFNPISFRTRNTSTHHRLNGCIRNWTFSNDTSLQGVEAFYPLIEDLEDDTGNYGDVILASKTGFPAPAAPTLGNPLCHNGVFINYDDGQDIRTAWLNGITVDDFQVGAEFKLTAIDEARPVFTANLNWRWLGFLVDGDGNVGVRYQGSNVVWSDTKVTAGDWHSALLKFEGGVLHAFLDDMRVLEVITGPLDHHNSRNFTTNDGQLARALNGCIRNFTLINDTTLNYIDVLFGDGFEDNGGD